jgi:hypothetical protein
MKVLRIAVTCAGLLMLNCAVSQAGLPSGTAFYNSSAAGFSGQYNSPDYRTGEACATSIGFYMPFIAFGDASVSAAASKQGIKKIVSVSHRTSMGHIMQDFCTVVRGY